VVRNDESKELLGVRCLGKGAQGVVQAAGVMIGSRLHVAELTRVPQPQPTILAALQQAARMTLGTSIHKARPEIEQRPPK
jgi:pyruvate/2-oxoglutarate dehydrogenase complex dihydrolipoamide dehydrogenase (E3) component